MDCDHFFDKFDVSSSSRKGVTRGFSRLSVVVIKKSSYSDCSLCSPQTPHSAALASSSLWHNKAAASSTAAVPALLGKVHPHAS